MAPVIFKPAHAALLATLLASAALSGARPAAPPVDPKAALGRIPLGFEANRGQTDPRVKFLARGRGYSLFLTPQESVLSLPTSASPGGGSAHTHTPTHPHSHTDHARNRRPTVLRTRLLGANPQPKLVGLDEQPGRASYFIGNDPKRWRTGIPRYGRVCYQGVYPGIDLLYYGNPGDLEYDFLLQPRADPSRIRMQLDGADSVTLQPTGDLAVEVEGRAVRLGKPVCYQVADGRRTAVGGRYVLQPGRCGSATPTPPHPHTPTQVGFQLAAYDHSQPLVIDPIFTYSTYLGGSGADSGRAVALDSQGNAYVTGFTESLDFPGAAVPPPDRNVFIAKLNAPGTRLVYSVYLGGTLDEEGLGIAVNGAGEAHVTGFTSSADFPVFNPALPFTPPGQDAFLAKLNAAGTALIYSTRLGGSDDDVGTDVVVSGGNAFVAGGTGSQDFPTPSAATSVNLPAGENAFAARFTSTGGYSLISILGGSGQDEATGIAVNSAGEVFLAGTTDSDDFPRVPAAPDPPLRDAFVVRLSANLATVVYSHVLGGEGEERAGKIVVDASSNAILVGTTDSLGFPQVGALAAQEHGQTDAFVTKLNAAGTGLIYSFYLGGSGTDSGTGIAQDGNGRIYVTGTTFSSDFPHDNALQPALAQGVIISAADVFVTQINANGSARLFSSYVGGIGNESDAGIAVTGTGDICLTGSTLSPDFPVASPIQPGPADPTLAGTDAFVTRIGIGTTLPAPTALTATAVSTSEIDLAWHDNSTTETAFEVEARGADRNDPLNFVRIATTGANITTLAHRLLRPHAHVLYRVRAINASGASGYSNLAEATTLSPPAAPSNLTAAALDSAHVQLRWQDNSDNETEFRIERRTDFLGGLVDRDTFSLPAGATSFLDDTARAEASITYQVSAVNAIGASVPSPDVVVTTMNPPTDLTAAASGSSVQLHWADNTGFAAHYVVERSVGEAGLGTFQVIAPNLAPNTTSFQDTGRAAAVILKYHVRAVNSTGSSSFSNVAETTPLAAPGSVQAALSVSGMRVTWTDTNSVESGYRVRRSVNGSGFSDVASLGANAVSFTDTALQPGTRYHYRVQAFSATATSNFGTSSVVTTPTTPAAPTDLAAQAVSGREIRLSWIDKSFFETEFRIERHDEGGSFVEVAAVPKDATEYLDQGLAPGHTYTYRVRATHATGASPYSNEASATTFGGRLQVPRKLSFGLVPRGSAQTRRLVVKNLSPAGALQVSVSEPSGPFRLLSGAASFTLAPGERRVLSVRFRPARPGRARGSLVVTSSDPGSPQITVRLGGTGL